MKISKNGVFLIKKFEGFSPEPYFCPAGKKTIGYGHVILDDEAFRDEGITEDEAEVLLYKDLQIASKSIEELVDVPLQQNQFDALCSFVFNVGNTAFSKSTLLKLLNEGQMQAASNQFKRWVYGNGRKLDGLVRRREAEYSLFNRVL